MHLVIELWDVLSPLERARDVGASADGHRLAVVDALEQDPLRLEVTQWQHAALADRHEHLLAGCERARVGGEAPQRQHAALG